jgi:hypothetical protein
MAAWLVANFGACTGPWGEGGSMKERRIGRRSLSSACGALTWFLLSACEPAPLTEQRFTEEPSLPEEQPSAGEQPPLEGQPPQEGAPPPTETAPPLAETPPQPTGRSWYVSMKGSDVGKGTVASPLRTLGRAASLAHPGDVIRVLPGTYSEQLVLESRGEGAEAITLRGEGPARPTLMPGSNRAPGAIIFVRGRWNLENLHVDVDGAPMAAVVFLPGADKSRLTGSELRDGTAGAGVIVQGARHVRIQDNLVHHFIKPGKDSHGVVVVGPSRDVVIRDNNIHHNSGDSIQCYGGTGPAEVLLIEDNLLHDNGENGVDLKQCNDVIVRNNQLWGFPNATLRPVGSSAGEAVLISVGARGVVVQGNTISKAGRGVSVLSQVTPPEDIWVERNTIQNIRNFPQHNGQGIRIAGGKNVHVVENTVEGTASYGLMLAADGMVVTGLTVRNNRVKGGPQRMLLRLGRESFRPGFSMRGNHYARGGMLSMDGVQEKFSGAYADYRKAFLGEHLPLSSPERLDVWRLLVGADQGSALLE